MWSMELQIRATSDFLAKWQSSTNTPEGAAYEAGKGIAEAFPKKLQQNTQGLDKFEIYVKHQVDLDNRNISQELRQEFENNGILLSSISYAEG